MATHYIENGSGGNQYYFDPNGNPNSPPQRSTQDRGYPAPTAAVTTISPTANFGSSEYTSHPTGVAGARSQNTQVRVERNTYNEDETYQYPQQHQSVAGFSKNVAQQQYQSSSPSPAAAAAPPPQVRATVRTANTQEQQQHVSSGQYRPPQSYGNYDQSNSPHSPQVSSQYHYDPRQQSTGTIQHSYHEFDQRTESPSRSREQQVQAQQVSVRSVPNSSHSPQPHQDQLQQYYSQLTPEQYQQLMRQQQLQRQQQEEQKRQQLAQQQQQSAQGTSRSTQDSQMYEKYQQRRVYQSSSNQEQQYRQQGQDQHDSYHYRPQQVQSAMSPNSHPYAGQHSQADAYYEQQHRAAAQPSPSSAPYSQEQYHATPAVAGAQEYTPAPPQQPQQRARTDSERQRQEEQDYYAAQLARQQQQQQQQQQQAIQTDQPTKPVGIRGLMNKFTGPTKIPTYESKSKITQSYSHSSSSTKTSTGSGQTTTTQPSKHHAMTYSALPKSNEPPVNSAAYYEMLQQTGGFDNSPSLQQSAAPPHIQGPAPGFGALRDRFKTGSQSDNTYPPHDQRPSHQSNAGNSSLSSLRDQYVNRAAEPAQVQDSSFAQRIQNVSRTIVGEDYHPQHQSALQPEEQQVQSQSLDDQGPSSEGALADGSSLSGASSLENDGTLNNASATEPASAAT